MKRERVHSWNDECREMDERVQRLEEQLQRIVERNQKVEDDKAWETSSFRILGITVITYFLTSLVFYLIGLENYLLNATIPTLGFYLSTQTLTRLKGYWFRKRKC